MWSHFCNITKRIRVLPDDERCEYCTIDKNDITNIPGKFWIYPARRYVTWPECQEYYYYLDKNNS